MGMFEGAAEKMKFNSSHEFLAEIYWNDLYDIETENNWIGMNRVVNAKLALELMKKPDGEGKFIIKINDNFAEWNNNTYIIEYGNGECTVKTTDANADIEATEHALMQMILGVYDFKHIIYRNDVKVNGNLDILKKAFYKKPILITDHF